MVWPHRGSRADSTQPRAARAGKRKGRSASIIPGGVLAASLGFGNGRAPVLARHRVGPPKPGRGRCGAYVAGRCRPRRELEPAMAERRLGGAGGVMAASSCIATSGRRVADGARKLGLAGSSAGGGGGGGERRRKLLRRRGP